MHECRNPLLTENCWMRQAVPPPPPPHTHQEKVEKQEIHTLWVQVQNVASRKVNVT
jgi:hypothetical protein